MSREDVLHPVTAGRLSDRPTHRLIELTSIMRRVATLYPQFSTNMLPLTLAYM